MYLSYSSKRNSMRFVSVAKGCGCSLFVKSIFPLFRENDCAFFDFVPAGGHIDFFAASYIKMRNGSGSFWLGRDFELHFGYTLVYFLMISRINHNSYTGSRNSADFSTNSIISFSTSTLLILLTFAELPNLNFSRLSL
jgi:hypothetical protein